MQSLIGEYDCKVDAKGRFMFPINLRKQLEGAFDKGFVINRNLHQKIKYGEVNLVIFYLPQYKILSLMEPIF